MQLSWSFLLTTFFFLLEVLPLSQGESGKHEVPVNRNRSSGSTPFLEYCSVQEIISLRMHPTLHISMEVSYCFSTRMISGALYHLETTWLERSLYLDILASRLLRRSTAVSVLDFLPLGSSAVGRVLPRPKSQILTLQSTSTRMLAGLMSLCMMLELWMKFMARSIL